jgi:CRP/FNR family transcriptional regulator, anaerobic regulatory protein
MFSAEFQPTPARPATPSFTGLQPRVAAPGSPRPTAPRTADNLPARRIGEMLDLVGDVLQPQKRIVRAGDVLYGAGERFDCLHVLNSGMFKVVKLTPDGREQVVGIKFRGDWLGLDGIARGTYGCDGVAMDTGEVWSFRYDALLALCSHHPALLTALHGGMSLEIARDRESLMSVCTLPADARVADFLRFIAESLATRGMRTDQITLRMTRAEIGNYLGLTLESVSRALSRLARDKVIVFAEKGRRDVQIPDLQALGTFVQRCISPEGVTLQ